MNYLHLKSFTKGVSAKYFEAIGEGSKIFLSHFIGDDEFHVEMLDEVRLIARLHNVELLIEES